VSAGGEALEAAAAPSLLGPGSTRCALRPGWRP